MNQDFFIRNRNAISRAMDTDVLVFSGNILMQSSNDASFAFKQEANFWYLTGIDAPGWSLIIEGEKSYLSAPDVDEVHRIFDGSLSDSDALAISGVDQVVSYEQGEALLEKMKEANLKVAALGIDPHKDHYDFALNPGPTDLLSKLQRLFGKVQDCRRELALLRAVKTPEEIQLIRQAIQTTIDGFEVVRSKLQHYSFEYELEAEFTYQFRKQGATGHAYDPIVAAGKNACTLHYGKNQAALRDGQLVLLDIGAQVQGYAADITRTYAYGEVSGRQRAVHVEVQGAHEQIIALLRPGLAVKEYAQKVDIIMMQALTNLGLMKTPDDYRKYFPHAISHGLGIDVHDSLGSPVEFKAGMVLTVEPGIYIPEEGIGVRIEDDILITDSGHENLSKQLSTSL